MLSSGWNCSPDGRSILILAKEPAPGRVKTRLAIDVGVDAATDLAWAFLEDALGLALGVGSAVGARVELRVDPHPAGPRLAASVPAGIVVLAQGGGDLGQRLRRAFDGRPSSARVAMGSDAPDLPAERLAAAFELLGDADVALGPASDGGYHLIGLAPDVPAAWLEDDASAIRWSSPHALGDTVAAARRSGLRVALGGAWPDVDDGAALRALADRLAASPAAGGAPRTRAWMAGHKLSMSAPLDDGARPGSS